MKGGLKVLKVREDERKMLKRNYKAIMVSKSPEDEQVTFLPTQACRRKCKETTQPFLNSHKKQQQKRGKNKHKHSRILPLAPRCGQDEDALLTEIRFGPREGDKGSEAKGQERGEKCEGGVRKEKREERRIKRDAC